MCTTVTLCTMVRTHTHMWAVLTSECCLSLGLVFVHLFMFSILCFLVFLYCYLRQGSYAIVVVCLSVCFSACLSACLLASLRKDFRTDFHEIFREGWQWAIEQMIKFQWRSGSRIRIGIRIATLVRRALAEVCTVPVLLVCFCYVEFSFFSTMPTGWLGSPKWFLCQVRGT